MQYDIHCIGEQIVYYRKQKGWTQEAFARQIGVSPQAVSKWETGGGCPDIALLPVIALTLDISLDQLFGREETLETAETEMSATEDGKVEEVCERSESPIDSLKFELNQSCQVTIGLSPDQSWHWYANGRGDFMSNLKIEERGRTLSFVLLERYRGFRFFGGGLSGSSGTLEVQLPMQLAKRLEWEVNGSGSLECDLDFEESDLEINGSSRVQARDLGHCQIEINGSGSVEAEQARDLDLEINGKGDVSLNELSGSADVEINGMANVLCASGRLSQLDVEINGMGKLKGQGLDCDRADIEIQAAGEVILGRVRTICRKEVSRLARLEILQEG